MSEHVLAVVVLVVGAILLLVLLRRAIIAICNPAIIARNAVLLTLYMWLIPALLMAVLGFLLAPGIVLFLALLAFVYGRRSSRYSGSHGTARWANATDLAGLLERTDGLPLGQVPAPTAREAIAQLGKAPTDSAGPAVRVLLASFRRKWLRVNATRFTHAAAFIPAGGGKSTGLVIPYLMTCRDPMIVIDVKGELYKTTAAHRRKMGQQVVVLDPYRVATDRPDCFNPLSGIDPNDPLALDRVRSLAEALVVRTGEEKEQHWNDSAEMWIAAVIAYVASAFRWEEAHLQSVAEILSDTNLLAKVRLEMTNSPAYGGMLARMAGQLGYFVDRELGSVLTTAARHLRFLGTAAIAESTSASSFWPDFRKPMTIYLCLPPDRLASQRGLLRLWIAGLLQEVIAGGLKSDRKVRFVLDEAAALGRMESIENAITQLRGYGLSMLFLYQSLGQLSSVYPSDSGHTFLSNMDVQVYGGVNDYQTAEHVSKQLGQTTQVLASENAGWSRTRDADKEGLQSASVTQTGGWSAQEQGRELLKPEEVLRLHEREMVVFATGIPPILVYQLRHYDRAFRPRRRNSFLGMAFLSVLAAVVSLFLAAILSIVLVQLIGNPEQPPSLVRPGVIPQQPTLPMRRF